VDFVVDVVTGDVVAVDAEDLLLVSVYSACVAELKVSAAKLNCTADSKVKTATVVLILFINFVDNRSPPNKIIMIAISIDVDNYYHGKTYYQVCQSFFNLNIGS
jgi:hypothetical protein